MKMSPSSVHNYAFLTEANYRKGNYQEYIKILEDNVESTKRSTDALRNLMAGYLRLNRKDEFQKILKELNSRGEDLELARYNSFEKQKQAIALKSEKNALEWLDYEFKNRGAGITAIYVRPEWDELRTNPRVQEYISQTGLSSYAVKGDNPTANLPDAQ